MVANLQVLLQSKFYIEMVRHIVFFKLKENNKSNNIELLKNELQGLKTKIEFIKNLEVGLNFNNGASAFDLSLIVDLATKDDLEKYRVHTEHQRVVEIIKEINDQAVVVDYEI